MLAMVNETYGGPEVVAPKQMPRPEPAGNEVLVKVMAAGVTTADWRLRASAFPGGMWLLGRLIFGLRRPRNLVLGSDFAGVVVAVGTDVTRFRPGQRVFGGAGHGAHAEYLTIAEDGALAETPQGLSDAEAAALPFGAVCALAFFHDVARIKPGHRVLIIGASGGVGSYAVQVAKWLGAEVTGVASGPNLPLIRDLGADRVVDYQAQDVTRMSAQFDVVFDTVGALSFAQARRILAKDGLFLPLNFGLADLPRAIGARLRRGPRLVLHVNGDTRESMEQIAQLVAQGHLRPVIDQTYPLTQIRAAYAHVETRRRKGAVVLEVAASDALTKQAA